MLPGTRPVLVESATQSPSVVAPSSTLSIMAEDFFFPMATASFYHTITRITLHSSTKQCSIWASQVALVVKNLPANAEDMRHGFNP